MYREIFRTEGKGEAGGRRRGRRKSRTRTLIVSDGFPVVCFVSCSILWLNRSISESLTTATADAEMWNNLEMIAQAGISFSSAKSNDVFEWRGSTWWLESESSRLNWSTVNLHRIYHWPKSTTFIQFIRFINKRRKDAFPCHLQQLRS